MRPGRRRRWTQQRGGGGGGGGGSEKGMPNSTSSCDNSNGGQNRNRNQNVHSYRGPPTRNEDGPRSGSLFRRSPDLHPSHVTDVERLVLQLVTVDTALKCMRVCRRWRRYFMREWQPVGIQVSTSAAVALGLSMRLSHMFDLTLRRMAGRLKYFVFTWDAPGVPITKFFTRRRAVMVLGTNTDPVKTATDSFYSKSTTSFCILNKAEEELLPEDRENVRFRLQKREPGSQCFGHDAYHGLGCGRRRLPDQSVWDNLRIILDRNRASLEVLIIDPLWHPKHTGVVPPFQCKEVFESLKFLSISSMVSILRPQPALTFLEITNHLLNSSEGRDPQFLRGDRLCDDLRDLLVAPGCSLETIMISATIHISILRSLYVELALARLHGLRVPQLVLSKRHCIVCTATESEDVARMIEACQTWVRSDTALTPFGMVLDFRSEWPYEYPLSLADDLPESSICRPLYADSDKLVEEGLERFPFLEPYRAWTPLPPPV